MTYVLDRDVARRLRRRPFRVWLSGVPEGAAFLSARTGDAAAAGASSARPSLLTVHDVTAPTTIRLAPGRRGGTFPGGTVIDLRVEFSRGPDVEDEEVLVRSVDVSGLPFRDLLTITPEGDELSLRAIEVVADEPMGELAMLARAAARAHLGRERTGRPLDLRIVIDLTASMSSAIADDSVTRLVDVLAGLAAVIGSDRPVEVHLAADPVVQLTGVPPAELAARTRDALRRTSLSCGFAGSRVPLAEGDTGATYVITDAVPPDVTELADRVRSAGSRCHLVLLAPDDGLRSPPDLPSTVIDPTAAGTSSLDDLLGTPNLLGEVVSSLLREGAPAPARSPSAR